jgi:predicted HAD superfamily Cof-like phosphohydrolase
MSNLIGKNEESGCVRGVHEHAPSISLEQMIRENDHPDMYNDVKQFHDKFNAHIGAKPKVPTLEVVELRKTLLEEEFHEVMDALKEENLNEIAKELCDLIVIVCGTAVSYGINLNPVWDLVHKSNMAKTGGGNRTDGKILKPEGWKKPDIALEIKRQIGE